MHSDNRSSDHRGIAREGDAECTDNDCWCHDPAQNADLSANIRPAKGKRAWLASKGNEKALHLSEADGWEVHEVAKAPASNSPEDIRQSMDLLQQIHRESLTSNLVGRLRLAEAEHCRLRSVQSSLLGEAAEWIDRASALLPLVWREAGSELAEEVSELLSQQPPQLKPKPVETTDWRSIARARGEVLDKLSDQISALKKSELAPLEPKVTLGIKVIIDPSMSPGEVRMRGPNGQEVRATGLRVPEKAGDYCECGLISPAPGYTCAGCGRRAEKASGLQEIDHHLNETKPDIERKLDDPL